LIDPPFETKTSHFIGSRTTNNRRLVRRGSSIIMSFTKASHALTALCLLLLLPTCSGFWDWVEDNIIKPACSGDSNCGGHRQKACLDPCPNCDDGYNKISMSLTQWGIVGAVSGGRTPCLAETNSCDVVRDVCVKGVNDEKKQRLADQHRVDYTAPLDQVTWVGTHNSYAAKGEGFNEYANQQVSPKDQLKAGFRVLNYDLHNLGNSDPVLCHDSTEAEANCAEQKGLDWGLQQIIDFVDENPGEVIMVILEDYFDDYVFLGIGINGGIGDAARQQAAGNIGSKLGSRVYSPEKHYELKHGPSTFPGDASARCNEAQLPISTLTKQEILDGVDAESAIIIATPQASYDGSSLARYSSCCECDHSIEWRKWVWEVPNNNIESYSGGAGLPSPDDTSYPEGRLTFIFEDRAFNKEGAIFNPGDLKGLMEKQPNMVGLDYAVIYDRYDDFLWSWGENEPASSSTGNDCAVLNEYDANSGAFAWKATACNEQYNVACWKEGSDSWKVTSTTHSFDSNIGNACREEYGPGWKFRMPYNAFQNKSLKQAAETTGATNIYIPYKREGSSWTDQCGPNGCSVPTAAPTTAPTTTPTASPSATPTATPTASPTSRPTASPTSSPTAYPTASPSTSPTYMVTGCKGRGVSCRRVCLDIEARDCIYQAEQDPYNVGPRCSRLLRQAERYGCLVESSVTPEATSTNAFGMMGGMMVGMMRR